ncbi:MAG: hypothetical protein IPG33_08005 [Betaproteobacteria bacterium]|jgi:hypothetical protein|nr:hypothetical protein [Betaproteobacteria bacterium]
MSDSTRDAIAALEEYLKRYPSGHFSELAQAQLDALLAGRGERRIEVISAEANPFTKGTARANQDYRPGDLFEYQVTDMLTKVVERTQMQRVVRVLPDRVMYNGGRLITDRLGNFLKMPNGATNGPNQFYATEYAVGRKWTTRYSTVLPNGQADEFEIDFKVAVREAVVVPAGRFDAYRVEGTGWLLGKSRSINVTYWIAPERVPRAIALENWQRQGKGIRKADRLELVAYTRL